MKSNFLAKFIGISGGVWSLSLAVMLVAISTSMTFSISPIYMNKVLGLTFVSIGIIEGVAEGLSQVSKLLSGVIGDYFRKKKPPLVIGFILAALSKPVFIFANAASWIMVSKVMERISNGVTATPRDAFISELSTKSNRGFSFGLMMTLKTVGCSVGSFLIAGLLYLTDDYRTLLWIGFFPCLAAVYLIVAHLREDKHHKQDKQEIAAKEEQRLHFKDMKLLNNGYWVFLGIATLFMLARFADGFLILRMQKLGASEQLCAAIIGIFNAVSALCCFPIGHISDRFDRSKILYFSFIMLLFSHLAFGFGTNVGWGLVGVLFWGAQRGTSQILFSAIIAEAVPARIIGTALGLFNLTSGLAAVFSGWFAGQIADKNLQFPFIVGAVISGISLLALYVRNNSIAKHDESIPETPQAAA